MRTDLPTGSVTLLFTDIEGSTKLLHELGPEAYAAALHEHRRALRQAFAAHGGVEIDTQGDAFLVAFPEPAGAMAAARDAQEALMTRPIRVRMGVHTGTPTATAQGYVGTDVHLGARIAAAAHGGQVILSRETRAVLDERFELLDLGEHRVKDFSEPVWLYQLGNGRFPPLKTISNTNLPRPASSFVGREREVAEISALLRDGVRFVTLTGPGGTGKTRLAIESAAELVPAFKNGVFWIPLAALRDPALVAETIGQIIGAKRSLTDHIGEREMLLVVDNLEQIVAAAPEVASLVEACPNLRVLLTSRERLRVRGEVEYPVPPLAEQEAVALFSERSRLDPDDTIADLCRRLDDLPLAVELAAARTAVMSPAQILERLSARLDVLKGGRDAEARQATLRATIEWSHDLLAPAERKLFARLAVFRGGCTLETAEAVASADLDVLQSLVDKSLVRRSGERFAMLETIRAFAEERLAASSDAIEIRDRHLAHFISLAETWYAARFASESTLLPVVDAETDNLRAALDWAHARGPEDEARLSGALAPLWSLSGRAKEAIDRLRVAVTRHGARDAFRARALTHLAVFEDDVAGLEKALAIWRELGDREGEALALESLGWVFDAIGDYARAQAAHEASLDIRSRSGSPELAGLSARAGLCHVLVARGETDSAARVARELLVLARRYEAAWMEEMALHFLADCPLVDGDWSEAERRYRQALEYARAAGLVSRATDEVLGVAMALGGRGDARTALRLAAAAYAKQDEIAKGSDAWWRGMQERLLGGARSALTDAEAAAAEREGRATGFDAVVDQLVAAEPSP